MAAKTLHIAFAKHLNERGLEYEKLAADLLRGQGFAVEFDPEHELWSPDLLVEGMPVEVKGSRLRRLTSNKMGYGFLLFKAGQSRRIKEKVTVLICYDAQNETVYPFIVPSKKNTGPQLSGISRPPALHQSKGPHQVLPKFSSA